MSTYDDNDRVEAMVRDLLRQCHGMSPSPGGYEAQLLALRTIDRVAERELRSVVSTVPIEAGTPRSLVRVEWEHMMRVLTECGGNRSMAARQLNIHRSSLQRRLRKDAPATNPIPVSDHHHRRR